MFKPLSFAFARLCPQARFQVPYVSRLRKSWPSHYP